MERAKGIEPSSSAWKADALPLSYARETVYSLPERTDSVKSVAITKKRAETLTAGIRRAIMSPCKQK